VRSEEVSFLPSNHFPVCNKHTGFVAGLPAGKRESPSSQTFPKLLQLKLDNELPVNSRPADPLILGGFKIHLYLSF
jgi:hypothetical protein